MALKKPSSKSASSLEPRVDALIAAAPAFAQPVLTYLRALVHEAMPNVTEDIKWGRTFFLIDGALVANMVAFKAHCSFGFWAPEMSEVLGADGIDGTGAGGSFGKITTVADLPAKRVLLGYLRKAADLVRTGDATSPIAARPRGTAKPVIPVPDDFAAALAKSKKAAKVFEGFSPSARREYLEWITTAKRQETREKRVAEAVTRIAAGKTRNEEYR